MQEINFESLRNQMVKRLEDRGIKDHNLLAVMKEIPRENFVPLQLVPLAYDDTPIPVSEKHTVPHPWLIAFNLQALKISNRDKVLELGTNSGYQTSILSGLARQVLTIEPSLDMVVTASLRVRGKGRNVQLFKGEITSGFRKYAPYDVIVCNVPLSEYPEVIIAQLAEGGRMIYTKHVDTSENIVLVTKKVGEIALETIMRLNYIPVPGLRKEEQPPAEESGQDGSSQQPDQNDE